MSVTDAQRRFLTLDQVAEQFQVSRRTVERLVAAEIMPAFRIGGSLRVSADELDEWVDLRRMSAVSGSSANSSAVGRSSDDDPAARSRDPGIFGGAVEPGRSARGSKPKGASR